MTPSERLKEIEWRRDQLERIHKDYVWLTNRVKRLTEELEEHCHCGMGEHVKGMKCNACVALESDE